MNKEIETRAISRKDFLRIAGIVATSLALGGCLPKNSVSAEDAITPTTSPLPTKTSPPKPTQRMPTETGPSLVTDTPIKPTDTPIPVTIEPQAMETAVPTINPEEPLILPIEIDVQDFSLSCESAAAGMVATYIQPTPPEDYPSWEAYFVDAIPENCNPHRGFRGSVSGRVSTHCKAEAGLGYGVYAEPVAAAFLEAGIPARAMYGADYDWVAEQIRNSRPVIVWMSWRTAVPRYEKDPETGQRYVLLLGQHVWTIIGVKGEGAERRFLVNDSEGPGQFWVRGFPRWDVFDNMSLVVGQELSYPNLAR